MNRKDLIVQICQSVEEYKKYIVHGLQLLVKAALRGAGAYLQGCTMERTPVHHKGNTEIHKQYAHTHD